ncbi:MAG: peptidoglycan DD-metalloendopeptidase family protein [Gemmatimonadota bacterium]
MPVFHKVTSGPVRGTDNHGSGKFGASRDGGKRSHNGLDFVALPGEKVLSPIEGLVVREARPYKTDPKYVGVVIDGTGDWKGYEVKMFYVKGIKLGRVRAGEVVGTAQDLGKKYPGITNHVHVEVRLHGLVVSPASLFEAAGSSTHVKTAE